ncbi:hypothetical protein CQW23_13845 [Capsicum baccatum]|uniref:Ubiquitin-like protease family profile domain-containing protein n=1 Tax=Capsicum baccatum TaxID=33114 RepID=A0A2G2WHG0_CAPBA|nr:hypothetical protein CQW23_13845 [Capsicum baccatum]
MPFFLTLRSVQTLSDPKVIDGIKMELFGATTITRKIILKSGLIVVDDGSDSGRDSGAAIGANDSPLTVFERTIHYDYDHTGCIDFSLDFSTSSECFACKYQNCKAKHDGVITSINALTVSVKKMKFKRGVIPSKRISYPYTPLKIKVTKRRRNDISKASLSIEKNKIAMSLSLSSTVVQCARATREKHELKKVDVIVEATAEEHNITVDNPSTASKEEEKVKPLINDYSEWIADGLLKHHVDRRRFGPSSEIQKLAKILSTYLDMSGFLDQKIHTDWSMIEAYWDKTDNPFDVQYVEGNSQRTIGSMDCGLFVATYIEYLSDGLQVTNDGLDAGLLHKRYATLL